MSREQPRPYRVRLMEGTRPALDGQDYLLVLDLTPGEGLTQATTRLNELLVDLCREDRASGDRVRRYHLDVVDAENGDRFLWPATALDQQGGR